MCDCVINRWFCLLFVNRLCCEICGFILLSLKQLLVISKNTNNSIMVLCDTILSQIHKIKWAVNLKNSHKHYVYEPVSVWSREIAMLQVQPSTLSPPHHLSPIRGVFLWAVPEPRPCECGLWNFGRKPPIPLQVTRFFIS